MNFYHWGKERMMQFLVGYNGSNASKSALSLARDHAKIFNARVLVLFSTEGGASETLEDISQAESDLKNASDFLAEAGIASETLEDISRAEADLKYAKDFLTEAGVSSEAHQLARGMTPGEDLVSFAEENNIDQIFVGIEKKSKTRKLLLGSTAQYVILKASCPVVTIK